MRPFYTVLRYLNFNVPIVRQRASHSSLLASFNSCFLRWDSVVDKPKLDRQVMTLNDGVFIFERLQLQIIAEYHVPSGS